MRHTFLKKDPSRREYPHDRGHNTSTRGNTKRDNNRKTIAKINKRKNKKLSKYGRTKNNEVKFRNWSKSQREARWVIDPDNAVLQELMRRIQEGAHGRMAPSLSSFDGSPMAPSQFKQVTAVELQVSLSKVELEAIFEHFDRDDSGTIDYKEVVHVLFGSSVPRNLTMLV